MTAYWLSNDNYTFAPCVIGEGQLEANKMIWPKNELGNYHSEMRTSLIHIHVKQINLHFSTKGHFFLPPAAPKTVAEHEMFPF